MTQNLSVKQKIFLSLWVTTFLVLVLVGTLASVWFVRDQAKRLDNFLVREVRSVQEILQAYLSENRRGLTAAEGLESEGFRAFLNTYLSERLNRPFPYKTTLGVFGPQGDLVQSSNFALPLAIVPPSNGKDVALATITDAPWYRMAVVPLEQAGRPLGTVRMACMTVTLGEVWGSFLASLLSVLVLVFVSFAFLGTLLIRWALKPIREMSHSAHDISESHLDLRIAVLSGRDEVSAMAQTLNQLLDRLERDFEFEKTLVGHLSHELRSPLAILRGRNEVALERAGARESGLRATLEDNLADIDNIVSLLNTLLSLARLEGRVDPVRMQACELGSLLCELIEELEPLWDEKNLSFHLALPGGASEWSESPPLAVRGDPILLRQVFLNILTNAYKYTPDGGRIELSIQAAGTLVAPVWCVVVSNPGPSLPEDSLELVFKRFYRVEVLDPQHSRRQTGLETQGFGLGLSIAKTLTELHNGTIRAFNSETGGAAFEVRLPQYVEESRKHLSRSLPWKTSPSCSSSRCWSFLLASRPPRSLKSSCPQWLPLLRKQWPTPATSSPRVLGFHQELRNRPTSCRFSCTSGGATKFSAGRSTSPHPLVLSSELCQAMRAISRPPSLGRPRRRRRSGPRRGIPRSPFCASRGFGGAGNVPIVAV